MGEKNYNNLEGTVTILNTHGQITKKTYNGKLGVGQLPAPKDHSKLGNLDYENSGHTGFASFKDIEDINNKLSKLNKLGGSIEISPTEPIDDNVLLWYEVSADINLDDFYLEEKNNELILNYQDNLELDFDVINNELIVTNDVSELDFNINENKEMEVSYGN